MPAGSGGVARPHFSEVNAMKRARLQSWCLLAAMLVGSALPATAAPPGGNSRLGVAVFDSVDPVRGRQIADIFLTDLGRTQRLPLVERSQLDKALKEIALTQTGLVDP